MVCLRNVTKDDYSLDLDVNEDQHKFVASYKSILDYAFDEQDKKFNKVSVTLFDSNDVARKLYEKAGFTANGYSFEDEYDMELSI